MNSSYLRFLFASLLVIAIQTWVLSPIALFRVATPFIYPILLLLLPVGIGRISLLLHGFAIGCIIDMLGLTPGLHAAALTATAFVRPMLLGSMVDRDTLEQALPLYGTLRSGAFVLFSLLLLIHHIVLYALEAGAMIRGAYTLVSLGAGYVFSWLLSLLALALLSSFVTSHD